MIHFMRNIADEGRHNAMLKAIKEEIKVKAIKEDIKL